MLNHFRCPGCGAALPLGGVAAHIRCLNCHLVYALPADGPVAAAPPRYDVVIAAHGFDRLAVLRAVYRLAGLARVDAPRLVEGLPQTVLYAVPSELAEAARTVLERAGAQVLLRRAGP